MDHQPESTTPASTPTSASAEPPHDGYPVGASAILAERRLHTLKFGDLFGVFEVDDFDRFRALMDAAPVNARWQAEMALLVDPCTDPATGFHRRLDEVFRLD